MVPPKQMKALYKSASSAKFKEQYLIEKGNHNTNWIINKKEYFKTIGNFIEKSTQLF
jgi:hypothetical protein